MRLCGRGFHSHTAHRHTAASFVMAAGRGVGRRARSAGFFFFRQGRGDGLRVSSQVVGMQFQGVTAKQKAEYAADDERECQKCQGKIQHETARQSVIHDVASNA